MAEIMLWERIKEAVHALGGKATYAEITAYVVGECPNIKPRNILTEIFACTVNHHARIFYKAKEEGVANQPYDFLYQPRGQSGCVEWYEPDRHGIWGNKRGEDGKLHVVRFDLEASSPVPKRTKPALKKKATRSRKPKKIEDISALPSKSFQQESH